MNAQRLLAVFAIALCFAASPWPSTAADPPLDAEAVLRKVELNVGLKNYEKVLLAKFETEFELQLGPPDRTLPPEQKAAWTEAQKGKCDLLVKMAVDLREQIKGWIAADNGAGQAKVEPKPVPEPIITDLYRFDEDRNGPLGITNLIDHDDRTQIVPRNTHSVQITPEVKNTVADVQPDKK